MWHVCQLFLNKTREKYGASGNPISKRLEICIWQQYKSNSTSEILLLQRNLQKKKKSTETLIEVSLTTENLSNIYLFS